MSDTTQLAKEQNLVSFEPIPLQVAVLMLDIIFHASNCFPRTLN
jgi:hypothetical protein